PHSPPTLLPPLSLHDARPISAASPSSACARPFPRPPSPTLRRPSSPFRHPRPELRRDGSARLRGDGRAPRHQRLGRGHPVRPVGDRKSTRLNSSHEWISYAVF